MAFARTHPRARKLFHIASEWLVRNVLYMYARKYKDMAAAAQTQIVCMSAVSLAPLLSLPPSPSLAS